MAVWTEQSCPVKFSPEWLTNSFSAATYQSEFDLHGEGFSVVDGLDNDDDRGGHGLGQLVGPDSVVLEGQVGEGDEATEAESQQDDFSGSEVFRREDVHLMAQKQAEPCHQEVDQSQGHVGEAVVHVDPFVEEDDADGGQKIYQQPGGDAAVLEQAGRHGEKWDSGPSVLIRGPPDLQPTPNSSHVSPLVEPVFTPLLRQLSLWRALLTSGHATLHGQGGWGICRRAATLQHPPPEYYYIFSLYTVKKVILVILGISTD